MGGDSFKRRGRDSEGRGKEWGRGNGEVMGGRDGEVGRRRKSGKGS